jgi:hypothetical protein
LRASGGFRIDNYWNRCLTIYHIVFQIKLI